ncbi:MAG: ATP-binding cassette domain-containing protein [Kiritimatiellia bacterium]|jgi:macrolide transport system ATP-binding/permease protein
MGSFLHLEHVSFSFPGMTKPLFVGVDAHFPPGWTGIVGPNGAGKTTLLRLAIGDLEPQAGRVVRLATAAHVPQRTDEPPPGAAGFHDACDPEALDIRRRLGIGEEWLDRWDTLSHGERKRFQIAAALWHEPDLLALDEPTNHIDADARRLLVDALHRFRGVGLLVSHDRELLDGLCGQCLFIDPPGAVMRPGGVTAGAGEERRERRFAREKDDDLRASARRLRRAAQKRHEEAQQQAKAHKAARSRKVPTNDHDGRAKRQLAKLTGKDSWAANQSAALARRAGKEQKARAGLGVKKEYEMGFWLEDAGCSARNGLVRLEPCSLPLGDGRFLHLPGLRVGPVDRIAVTGPNGSGKSTLVRRLLDIANVPPGRIISVPQEITAEESARLLGETAAMPREELGKVMTCFSRLGSRPARLLESEVPTPGEIRKLLLSLGVVRGPHLIVMDEPTNHLDLPSIECLEEALAACPCALLLASHDERFLRAVTTRRWSLHPESNGDTRLRVD